MSDVETRNIVNKLKNPDGSITEVHVLETRPKKQHDTMMRHMANLAEGKRLNREAAAAAAVAVETVDESPPGCGD